jgi:hypothetical protein
MRMLFTSGAHGAASPAACLSSGAPPFSIPVARTCKVLFFKNKPCGSFGRSHTGRFFLSNLSASVSHLFCGRDK